jgi:biopolymer transport protein ExbD
MKNTYKLIIGFLILFIFTVTFYFAKRAYKAWDILQKPLATQLNMPNDTNREKMPLKDFITIFLIGKSKVYFEAKDKSGTLKIDSKGFNLLIENQEKIIGKTTFTVIIKATKNAKYKDMVDILDKLALLEIKRFSILGIAEDDNKRIELFLSNQPH